MDQPRLHEIHGSAVRSEDATAKMICFVQWEDLKRKALHFVCELQFPGCAFSI